MSDWPRASTIHAMGGNIDVAYEELRAEIERLFLENGEIANTLGAENLKLRALLREARHYVSDAGSHEEPGEHQQALLSDIDAVRAENERLQANQTLRAYLAKAMHCIACGSLTIDGECDCTRTGTGTQHLVPLLIGVNHTENI